MRVLPLVVAFAIVCQSCKTIDNVSQASRTDTVYIAKTERVEKIVRDSVIIAQRGDTVYLREVKIRYIDRFRCDTIYKAHTDTLFVKQTEIITDKKSIAKHIIIEALMGIILLLMLYFRIKRI